MTRTQAVTILFCDLVASTERRARLGDDAYDDFSRQLFVALRDAIARAGGREVSNAGDGMMIVFPDSVADAVSCAIEMHRTVVDLDRDDPPRLRIGISCGEVAQVGDQYSGMPIVEAARLEAAAAPGQTLANVVVRALVGTRRALRFRDVGPLTLKGIPEPLTTVEVLDDSIAAVDLPGSSPPRVASASTSKRRWLVVAIGVAVAIAVMTAFALIARVRGSHDAPVVTTPGISRPSGYTPRFASTACPSDIRKNVPEATCGYLTVPENRAHPAAKQLRLLVQQAPARVPGGSKAAPNIDVCGCNDLGTSLARDHATLIQIGARGFTNSTPDMTCPEMVAVTHAALALPSNDRSELDKEAVALRQCRTRLTNAGIDLAQYNIDTAALDVIDLMVALHIKNADFTASDATSAVVFDVLRRVPGAVRSLTLDNPAPPGATGLSDAIGNLSRAFDHFSALCHANTQCAKAYPDLSASYLATYRRFHAHPQLVMTPNPDDSSAPAIPVLIDGPRAADALATALGDPTTYGLIPAAITTTTATPLIATEVLRGDYYSWHTDAPWGALASYFCAYDVNTSDPNAIALAARTLPQFSGAQNAHWAQWCAAWKVPDVSAALSIDVASPVPALLFRGDLSPSGTANWLNTIQRGLPNAQSATFPTLGDGLISGGPPCLAELRRDFLANPLAKLDTADCERQSPPIEFDAPAR